MGDTTFILVIEDKLLVLSIITMDKNHIIRPVAISFSEREDSETYAEGLDIIKTSLDQMLREITGKPDEEFVCNYFIADGGLGFIKEEMSFGQMTFVFK